MKKFFLVFIAGVLTSLYYFPIQLSFIPMGLNTKMILAVCGLVGLGVKLIHERRVAITQSFLSVSAISFAISLIALFSIVINNTPDTSYVMYFMSMWTWLGGAYALCGVIRQVHNKVDIDIITKYLLAVCVAQCFLALLIDTYPAVKSFVNTYVIQGQEFMDRSNVRRLYGIGAFLDTAGIRFSLVLVLTSHMIVQMQNNGRYDYMQLYIIAYLILCVVGNMISRTTTVGLIISIVYLLIGYLRPMSSNVKRRIFWKNFVPILLIAIIFITYKFNADEKFATNMRFGFEGFFSIIEQGRWQVGSNDQLINMIKLPDNFKTWIVGDGYFVNPLDCDPWYVGPITGGYYMETDVGYLRFIFYFGLLGLLTFSVFISKVGQICARRDPRNRVLYMLLVLVNFVVWLKVSTDCFVIFAILLLIDVCKEDIEIVN